ncbi:uncharacterized protein LOC135368104 isoform X2 [Ornithodoros turicata]|uniref:uncharacterized protein LOC135368104 isoform X2 n=1 Tax=Ornithodoros turicata TaxID=34597 RepID=UPI00313A30D9
MLHTFSAVYLAIIVFALCTAVSRHPSTAMELVPVRESHPDSTMYLWRPYTVYFVGDRHFDPLQRVVPRSENVTQFDLYAQSYLNMVVYYFREQFYGCDVKIKVIGTRIFTAQEEELYLPKISRDGRILADLRNVTFEEFFALNPEVDAADIVVFLTGYSLLYSNDDKTVYSPDESRICTRDKYTVLTDQAFSYAADVDLAWDLIHKMGVEGYDPSGNVCLRIQNSYRQSLTGNAVSNGEPVLCYNTMNTCCLPDFYGIYNLRREPLCKRYNGRELALTYVGEKHMCDYNCLEEKGLAVGGSPIGTVKKATSEYWTRSLLCPSDEDEICNPYGSHHHRTYKDFKKAIINAWELDDYEVPETDVTFCMQ